MFQICGVCLVLCVGVIGRRLECVGVYGMVEGDACHLFAGTYSVALVIFVLVSCWYPSVLSVVVVCVL